MKNIAIKPVNTRATGRFAASFLAVLALTACQQLPQKVVVDFAEPKVNQMPMATPAAARPATGSLFQNAGYRPAFEDRRARAVGDTVTIQIVENVTASQKSTSTVNRASSIDSSVTALPFNSAEGLGKLGIGASTNNAFSGKGGTESANTFSGSITATVIEVQPNGHLVVAGEKQIGVNQNVDVLRFSGTVDPRLVQPGSIVSSTQVANVRVESRGRGAQGEAQTVGWLSRFFLGFQPF
ncbi:MAG: flagellar basal body L-ring protein FlgH [Burkholderiales bacterium]|nr:flagellar basal body L-ring protein FlgH [Burkholderiales bacterium]